MNFTPKFQMNLLDPMQIMKYRFLEQNKKSLCQGNTSKVMYVAEVIDLALKEDFKGEELVNKLAVPFNKAFSMAWIALNETYNKTENFIVRFKSTERARARRIPCVMVTMSIKNMPQYQNGAEDGLTLITGLRAGYFNNDAKTFSFDDKFYHIQLSALFYDAVYFVIRERHDTYLLNKVLQAFEFDFNLPNVPKLYMSSLRPAMPWNDVVTVANKSRNLVKECIMAKADNELMYGYYTHYVKNDNPKRKTSMMRRVNTPVLEYCNFPKLTLEPDELCMNKQYEQHLFDCVEKRPIQFVGRTAINEYLLVANQDML